MTGMRDFHIRHLIDAPNAAPALARWFVDEWTPWYGYDGPGDAVADLAACTDPDAIPLCLVALDDSGGVLGTASLRSPATVYRLDFAGAGVT